jgi:hypothetical protein
MKILLLLLPLFLSACGSYVPVSYRRAEGYVAPKGTSIRLVFPEDSAVGKDLQQTLRLTFNEAVDKDGWWTLAPEKGPADFELLVRDVATQSSISGSIRQKDENSKERIREADCTARGDVRFVLNSKRDGQTWEHQASATAQASSEVELPKEINTKSFFPVLGVILGIDPERERTEGQDAYLTAEAGQKLQRKLGPVMLQRFTPELVTEKVELDDDHDDIRPVAEFARKNDLESAQRYLELLLQRRNRAYVIYNLAAVKEARGQQGEACQLYQTAWEKKPKRLYLKQKAACETRLGHSSRVGLN